MSETFYNFFKKFSWQDIAFIALTLLFTIIFISHASSYKEIPSPVFGGDFYRDRGFVQNIVSGGAIWSDGFYASEINYYGYLLPAVQAGIALLFNLTVNQIFIYFPILLLITSLISWYLLGKLFFKDKTWALLCCFAFLGTVFEYSMKTGHFAFFTFIPLFFYFWIKFETSGEKKDAILAGLILGIMPLIYGGTFLSLVIILVSYILYNYIKEIISLIRKKEFSIKNVWQIKLAYLKKYWLFAIVAIAFALIYFAPLLIKYNMHIVNDVPKWGDPKVELTGLGWMWGQIKYLFFYAKSLPFLLVSLTALIGLIGFFITKKNLEKQIILFAIIVNVITVQHQVITYPLFGVYFWSVKLFIVPYLMPLLLVFGVKIIAHAIGKNMKKSSNAKEQTKENKTDTSNEEDLSFNLDPKTVIFGIFCILLILTFTARFNDFKSSQWVQVGMQESEYMNSLQTMADYLEANLEPDQTVLSNDESGFMLAVLSGRKVVLTRRTHASYYVDIDERIADAAVAMYGNDIEKSKEILKKYNVKYLYFDQNLLQYPMRTNPSFKQYFADYDVEYIEAHDRYDIALLPEHATLMDILIINPQNMTEFLTLFEPVYYATVQGQPIAQILKLRE